MSEETDDPPQPPEQPTLLGNVDPGEMLARGMQSVKMTSGTAGAWQPPTLEEAAQLFRGYEVLKLLGRGGMGAVYQARQIELDRLVAIKLLPLEVSVDKDFADRFRREARAMAKLNHPNIISVHDFGTTSEGHLYFAMEYVEGANLAEIIHRVGLDSDQALSVAEQVCAALSYAHDKGIVHRDIKPANVMIDPDSHVKVADFGLARLTDGSATDLGHTMTGTVMGTPDYMAPEQMRGMNVDHRADIYSVGVMIYEMLCREVPRGAFAPPSVRGGCDPRIDVIVLKAMQPDPEHRFQSTREMKREVSATRLALPESAHAPLQAVLPPAAKKSKVPLYAGLAIGVLIAAAATFLFFKPKPESVTKAPLEAAQPPGASLDKPANQNAATPPPVAPAASFLSKTTKDAPFVNSLGMKFVPVPIVSGPTAGQRVLFSVWDTLVQDYAAYAGAKKVDDSWTKQAKDGVPAGRELNHPVVGVSWEDAQAFCQWLTEKETAEGKLPKGLKYRLPTDEEWSWAVGLPPELGATPAEKSHKNSVDFPWGKDYPPRGKVGNYADEAFHAKFPLKEDAKDDWNKNRWIAGYTDGYATTSPVGSFPANAYGLYDMGGNVFQWCEDWYDASHKDRVLRGASWVGIDRYDLLSSNRCHFIPGNRNGSDGFRCVVGVSAR
jgi:serine/threonine protein kinase